ncbi:MAG: capsule assembly Wzi family protein [Candidatus Angelobacter sp.]
MAPSHAALAVAFGKQSLWLSPTEASPLMVSDNADPMYMLRLSRTSPWVLPGFFHWLRQVRGEATSAQMLTSVDLGPNFLYFNSQYHDANTNKGFLFGSPTGRDARSYQGCSAYHFSATNKLVFSFRELKASNVFLPGGGTETDASVRFEWKLRSSLLINTLVQGERWLIPILRQNSQKNVTGQIQLT